MTGLNSAAKKGTVLETELGPSIGQSPLWSTQAVIDHPDAIFNAHLAYIRAGATIIETATFVFGCLPLLQTHHQMLCRYQADVSTLVAAGLNDAEARKTMRKAVELAQRAKAASPLGQSICIALSLGPFGATLRPTQEFLGFYPPPYGPQGYSESGPNTREFERAEDAQAAVDALAQFHFQRLLVYCSDPAVWDAIDYIAFETVLLEREVKGIRKAMTKLTEWLSSVNQEFTKQWWISFVCPGPAEVQNIENLAFAAVYDVSETQLPPNGIGINCTSLQTLPGCLIELNKAVPRSLASSMFLVVYPNGGEYDTEKQSWKPRSEDDADLWADQFAIFLRSIECGTEGRWKGVIAGGCCRTDPSYIEKLKREMTSSV